MEVVVFMGLQASGKSSFCGERLFDTHVRINLDMLRTRHREKLLIASCIEAKQPYVVDNTNPTREDRVRYIHDAKSAQPVVAIHRRRKRIFDLPVRDEYGEFVARLVGD